MPTLKKKIERAAFWDGHVCLTCLHVTPEGSGERDCDPCPECGAEGLQEAGHVLAFLERVEEEE